MAFLEIARLDKHYGPNHVVRAFDLAEYDKVVLLDADNRMLDLFPMYQLVESDVTRYERHLCFMKTAKGQQILGEDAHTALEMELTGYVQLEKLQERHKSETPEKAKKSKMNAK